MHGIAVTLLSDREVEGIQLLARVFKMQILELPSPIPREIYSYASVLPEEDDDSLGVDVYTHTRDAEPNVQSIQLEDIESFSPRKDDSELEGVDTTPEQNKLKLGGNPTQSKYECEEALYAKWIRYL